MKSVGISACIEVVGAYDAGLGKGDKRAGSDAGGAFRSLQKETHVPLPHMPERWQQPSSRDSIGLSALSGV